jgi:hypothetical protein
MYACQRNVLSTLPSDVSIDRWRQAAGRAATAPERRGEKEGGCGSSMGKATVIGVRPEAQ